MSPQRDTRPPANKFQEIEAALDKRVLAALAAAWEMAIDRRLVVGHYVTREGVQEIAAELAEPISDALAADVIVGLNDRPTLHKAEQTSLAEEILDHVWSLIE